MNVYLISLAIITAISSYCHAVVVTEYSCNYTLNEKTGCKDDLNSVCIDKKCQCKDGYPIVLRGAYCVKKICSDGEYYEEFQNKCIPQSRATPNSKGSSCRYDYQCRGTHVTCKIMGYNRNCVCDPGFTFEEISGVCKQQYGLGGYCIADKDCDLNVQRKLYCQFDTKDEKAREGTCQCIPDHRYNYEVDGCESMEVINERRWQMRGLIILMVVTGIVFGVAMTCNMGLFGRSSFPNEIILKRIVEQRQRHENDLEAAQKKKLTASLPQVNENINDKEESKSINNTSPNKTTFIPKNTSDDVSVPLDDAIIAIDDQRPLEALEDNSRRIIKTSNGVKLMQF